MQRSACTGRLPGTISGMCSVSYLRILHSSCDRMQKRKYSVFCAYLTVQAARPPRHCRTARGANRATFQTVNSKINAAAAVTQVAPQQADQVSSSLLEERKWSQYKWTVYRGVAYDLTSFVRRHPAGSWLINLAIGRDCTALFESYHLRPGVAAAQLKKLPVLQHFPVEAVPSSPYPNDSDLYNTIRYSASLL